MAPASSKDLQEANRVYNRYVEPLEPEHEGEYAAVTPDGRLILGPTLLDVVERAPEALGSRNYIFKVGERTVGKWRTLSTR